MVKYFGQTVTSATTVLIMECLEDLTMAYNRLQLWGHEASVKMHAACVAEGLSFLHQKGVIHRDIKPRNPLLDTQTCTPGICKIADFGSAELGNRALTFVGAVEYMAPERVRRDDYSTAADWWSLGCVVYELLLGQKCLLGQSRKCTPASSTLTLLTCHVCAQARQSFSFESCAWKSHPSACRWVAASGASGNTVGTVVFSGPS